MPHSIRIYRSLRGCGFSEEKSLTVASIVEAAKSDPGIYDRNKIMDQLCDADFSEAQAEALTDALRNCFPAQFFATWFNRNVLKLALVRAGFSAVITEAFLISLEPGVVTPRTPEPRVRIQHQPSPGRVVMCDFSYLRKPEMQKERRAIVVSHRSPHSPGRCAVVPVSMTESNTPHPHHYEFAPGSYPFFHSASPVWATCDHLYTVALDRLWMVNVNRRPQPAATVSAADLAAIRGLVGTALGVPR